MTMHKAPSKADTAGITERSALLLDARFMAMPRTK